MSCIAVNDCYRIAPHARALYAADPEWWDFHIADVSQDFEGELWTQDSNWHKRDPRELGIQVMQIAHKVNLSDRPGVIHSGSNSGFQAIGLAWQLADFGPLTIILLGYDMQKTAGRSHWFGDHPQGLARTSNYDNFIRAFETIDIEGVEIINCTRETALTCFPRMDLETCMARVCN